MLHDSEATPKLTVIGAGAWGTMIAVLLAKNNPNVTLWARRADFARELERTRANSTYLPGLLLPANLTFTADLNEAMEGSTGVFMVVPSKGLRGTLEHLPPAQAFVSCTKGLEVGTLKRFSEVIAEYQPQASLAALSGPNLAKEIALGLPASATVASKDEALASAAQGWLNSNSFRVYRSRDIVGVEVSGAMKNVIALAAGMCDGLGLGDNAKASIITRGLAEIVRLGQHLGGEAQTFYGLAGLGDMIATCVSSTSRNHTAGERIARGATLAELEASQLTAEGIPTVRAVVLYGQEHELELPIANEIYKVIYEGKPTVQALRDLMGRVAKPEW